ncbi:MAG: HIT family protein [Saprospiraceae bacterium]|nr:HIT family protein [Saprospiraceae bacterium]
MATLFSKIISGEIPCYKIAENNDFLAFLDINPLAVGHTLVVPKRATDYIFDMDDVELGDMMIFSKWVARAIKSTISCRRIGVCVIGLEVPHAHIHLIPMNSVEDMNFARPKLRLSPEELSETADQINNYFN